MITISPTMIRISDERMSSAPIRGPMVVTLRGRPPTGSPNWASS